MIGDRELLTFRHDYYNLLVLLFWKEPAGDLLLSLSDGIKERVEAAQNLHPLLARGWEELRHFLADTAPETLESLAADEYTLLFIGPHHPQVTPYESHYLTGRLLDRPLAELKGFLKSAGIERQDEYREPEDFLAFELEVMRWLIGKQKDAKDSEEEARWLKLQSDFLKEHLLIWAPSCCQEIEMAQKAKLYRCVALILRGFLEMERALFREWGLEEVTSLEEARKRYMAIPTWRGPTFDGSASQSGGETTPPIDKKH